MVLALAELFLISFPNRGSLFGGGSPKMVDADLRRLYTATSLMQIDDNIMRCVCYILHLRRRPCSSHALYEICTNVVLFKKRNIPEIR